MARRRNHSCALCGKKRATGWAWIGDDRYCHGDDDPVPTCYMRGQRTLLHTYRFEKHDRVAWTPALWEPPF